jgi:hypothetical protein
MKYEGSDPTLHQPPRRRCAFAVVHHIVISAARNDEHCAVGWVVGGQVDIDPWVIRRGVAKRTGNCAGVDIHRLLECGLPVQQAGSEHCQKGNGKETHGRSVMVRLLRCGGRATRLRLMW